jgi:hypothetical protein
MKFTQPQRYNVKFNIFRHSIIYPGQLKHFAQVYKKKPRTAGAYAVVNTLPPQASPLVTRISGKRIALPSLHLSHVLGFLCLNQ